MEHTSWAHCSGHTWVMRLQTVFGVTQVDLGTHAFQKCVTWDLLGLIPVDSRHTSSTFPSHPHSKLPHEEFGYHLVLFGKMLLRSLLGNSRKSIPHHKSLEVSFKSSKPRLTKVTRPSKALVKEVMWWWFFLLYRKNNSGEMRTNTALRWRDLSKQDKNIILINIITESQSVTWLVTPIIMWIYAKYNVNFIQQC